MISVSRVDFDVCIQGTSNINNCKVDGWPEDNGFDIFKVMCTCASGYVENGSSCVGNSIQGPKLSYFVQKKTFCYIFVKDWTNISIIFKYCC